VVNKGKQRYNIGQKGRKRAMIKTIEEQKKGIKKRIEQMIDDYYEEFENSSKQEGFDINKIEKLMIGNERKLKEALREADGELVSRMETDIKKNARGANASGKEQKKIKR
jgi:hypothetical protein